MGTPLTAVGHNLRGQVLPQAIYTENMSRRLWIVWLMLALLPLRGWAVASMTMEMTVVEPPVIAVADVHVTQGVANALPCHEAAGDDGGASSDTCHACTLCDLCHSAVSVFTETALSPLPLPDALPRAAMAHDTGLAAVGGLERPPRIVNAPFTA